jgi:hypothetical protein
MERFVVHQFDASTYVVLDQEEQREICVCGNYDNWDDAKERAEKIVMLLNEKQKDLTINN